MLKITLIFLFCLGLSSRTWAFSKRDQLLRVVNEELREIERLNKQTRSSRPVLLLRLAEIYLEKARLLKEEENEKILSLPSSKRKKMNTRRHYKKSRSFFLKAQKTAYFILKNFRSFKKKGEVYYIMAYNAKEFSDQKKAQKFFHLAIRNSPRGSYTRTRSTATLAEMYFNQRNYKKAIPLYESSLKGGKK